MGLTVADGKGTGLNVLADPERLRRARVEHPAGLKRPFGGVGNIGSRD
jgi:hypothetical protein